MRTEEELFTLRGPPPKHMIVRGRSSGQLQLSTTRWCDPREAVDGVLYDTPLEAMRALALMTLAGER